MERKREHQTSITRLVVVFGEEHRERIEKTYKEEVRRLKEEDSGVEQYLPFFAENDTRERLKKELAKERLARRNWWLRRD